MKEKKIKKLESQLALSLEDKTRSERKLEMLLEELQNIDLNATAKVLSSPEKTPSKNDTTNKRKFMKKQHSMFSFLAHHIGDKNVRNDNSTSPGLIRRRTVLDREHVKSGPNTPIKGVSNNSRMDEIRTESGNSHNESERNADAGAKADDNYSLSELHGDLGSKACTVM
jgi:intein-encoded DNA endonuclease-like protein